MSPGAKKTYAVNAPSLFLFTQIINKETKYSVLDAQVGSVFTSVHVYRYGLDLVD